MTLDAVPDDVRPFDTSANSFRHRSPLFDRVRSYASANTIAITWDLNWRATGGDAGDAREDPEQHLQHYHVSVAPTRPRQAQAITSSPSHPFRCCTATRSG